MIKVKLSGRKIRKLNKSNAAVFGFQIVRYRGFQVSSFQVSNRFQVFRFHVFRFQIVRYRASHVHASERARKTGQHSFGED
jgi:hypothetical protein